jgi:hypothetical protein
MALKQGSVPSQRQLRLTDQQDLRAQAFTNEVVTLTSREEFAREINTLWDQAAQRFLLIGRYLMQAKATLPHGEYQAMIERELRFSTPVARMLKAVAEKVEAGIIPEDMLPRSYTTAYQLITLPPDAFEIARKNLLIRPDLQRAEILAFKRSLRQTSTDELQARTVAEEKLAQLRRYLQEQQAITRKIAELRQELVKMGVSINELDCETVQTETIAALDTMK